MQYIAQAAASIDLEKALFAYGPMGIMLCWFMLMAKSSAKDILAALRDLGAKLDKTNHNINGWRMASLLGTISNESTSEHVRKVCQDELARATLNTPHIETHGGNGR